MTEDEQKLRLMGDLLSKQFEGFGFALIVFPFGDSGTSNYISNAERKDMIKALRETADRLELNEDIPVTEGNA